MSDLAGVYDGAKQAITELVRDLDDRDLDREVPATPGWKVRDIVAHLVGDVGCVLSGDYPLEFFMDYANPAAVRSLNEWTAGHIRSGEGRTIEDLLGQWDELVPSLYPMLAGEAPWPGDIPDMAAGVMVTDVGVHLHDLYGAFGIKRDRDGGPVRVPLAGYVAMVDTRLQAAGGGRLTFDLGDKTRVAGRGEPEAVVAASRFELFRALSGRRSPEQIEGLDWQGDPAPFVPYFYPYGERRQALVE